MMMEMSRSIAHPASYNRSSSSSSSDDQLNANASVERKEDVHSHIVELSKILDSEIRSNRWEEISKSFHAKTIFRVPILPKEKLHAGDRSAYQYQPTFLSIGPYHRATRNDATEEMRRNEQGKLFLLRLAIPDGHGAGGGRSVQEYLEEVKSMEVKARGCYEGDVEMDPDAFCRMLLLDAFQLIMLLLGSFGLKKEMEAAGGGGACQGSMIKTLDVSMTFHDLMMLENQIPFFVVEKIHELLYGNGNGNAVRQLAWETINGILGGVPSSAPNIEFQHLVHVCHVYLKPTCLNNVYLNNTGTYGRFRRATEYYEAGVKFRRWCAAPEAEGGAGSSSPEQRRRRPMLDVAFTGTDGVLSLALQVIDEKTGYILRNVLAYEQKYYWEATHGGAGTSYVTAYVVFLSQLLGTADDVALLSRRGVLEHLLGDDAEVCALFRGLADGLAFDPGSNHYLKPVGLALQAHCRCRRYRWRAWIVRHRFGNPWLVAAWLFGAFAVLCTIVQTVFAVLSYLQHQY